MKNGERTYFPSSSMIWCHFLNRVMLLCNSWRENGLLVDVLREAAKTFPKSHHAMWFQWMEGLCNKITFTVCQLMEKPSE